MNNGKKPAHIAQQDWDDVDSPALTDTELAGMRRASEVEPDLVAQHKKMRGRPKVAVARVPVTLRMEERTLDAFKAGGPGWQTRINEVLAEYVAARTHASPETLTRAATKLEDMIAEMARSQDMLAEVIRLQSRMIGEVALPSLQSDHDPTAAIVQRIEEIARSVSALTKSMARRSA